MTSARRPKARLLPGLAVWFALAPAWVQANNDGDRPPPGMKARVFELKNQETDHVLNAVRPLASGVKGAMITDSDTLRTITVRDFPENIAAIEQALRKLDAPTPPRPDVDLQLRVLVAVQAGSGQVPADMDDVVKELQSTLNFKGYHQVASVTHRIKVGAGAGGKSMAQLLPPTSDEPTTAQYRYSIEHLAASPPRGVPKDFQLRRFRFALENKSLGDVDIDTGLITMKEGQKIVVGRTSVKNRAVVVVVSAKVVR